MEPANQCSLADIRLGLRPQSEPGCFVGADGVVLIGRRPIGGTPPSTPEDRTTPRPGRKGGGRQARQAGFPRKAPEVPVGQNSKISRRRSLVPSSTPGHPHSGGSGSMSTFTMRLTYGSRRWAMPRCMNQPSRWKVGNGRWEVVPTPGKEAGGGCSFPLPDEMAAAAPHPASRRESSI